jgi:hypothetical protein
LLRPFHPHVRHELHGRAFDFDRLHDLALDLFGDQRPRARDGACGD